MIEGNVTVDEQLLESLLQGHDGLAGLIGNGLNQILRAQANEALGAAMMVAPRTVLALLRSRPLPWRMRLTVVNI